MPERTPPSDFGGLPDPFFPSHVEDCICPRFRDIAPSLIADLTCPVHGINGTDPGDKIVEHDDD